MTLKHSQSTATFLLQPLKQRTDQLSSADNQSSPGVGFLRSGSVKDFKKPTHQHPNNILFAQSQQTSNHFNLNNNAKSTTKHTGVGGVSSSKVANNNIKLLTRPRQVRLVNFDYDSPRMKRAMVALGLQETDLDVRKRKEDFQYESMAQAKVANQLNQNMNAHLDEALANLRFKHYQQRLMERINRLLNERKRVRPQDASKVIDPDTSELLTSNKVSPQNRIRLGSNSTA